MNKKIMTFQDAQEKLKAYIICAFITCIGGLVVESFSQMVSTVLLVATVVLMGLIIHLIFTHLRCPHCGKVITFGAFNATNCPRCKRNLMTGKKGKK